MFKKLLEEFNSRKAPKLMRNAVRVHAGFPDQKCIYETLSAWIDTMRRNYGVKVTSIEVGATAFDWGTKVGVYVSIHLKKDPNASALVFVAQKYEALIQIADNKNGLLRNALSSVVRSRKIERAKAKARSALK